VRSGDDLGALIRRQNEEANTAPQSRPAPAKNAPQDYGATDRRALDRLFETSGGTREP